jgi:hypothetical protein
MGHHPRLGRRSLLSVIDAPILWLIMKKASTLRYVALSLSLSLSLPYLCMSLCLVCHPSIVVHLRALCQGCQRTGETLSMFLPSRFLGACPRACALTTKQTTHEVVIHGMSRPESSQYLLGFVCVCVRVFNKCPHANSHAPPTRTYSVVASTLAQRLDNHGSDQDVMALDDAADSGMENDCAPVPYWCCADSSFHYDGGDKTYGEQVRVDELG